MSYPFPSIERKVYPKTFLKDVHMTIRFDAMERTSELDAEVEKFFKESFSLEGISTSSLEKGIKVFSKNMQIVFGFGLNMVELTVKQPDYVSYTHIQPCRELMKKYLCVLKVKDLKGLMMYKYNQLEYQTTGDKQMKDVMRDVFSGELMLDEEDIPTDNTRWEKTRQIPDGNPVQSLFTIEYGYRKDAQDSRCGALTLKTQIESTMDGIALTDVEKRMELFNQTLDDGFHWCVVPEIIKMMKEL